MGLQGPRWPKFKFYSCSSIFVINVFLTPNSIRVIKLLPDKTHFSYLMWFMIKYNGKEMLNFDFGVEFQFLCYHSIFDAEFSLNREIFSVVVFDNNLMENKENFLGSIFDRIYIFELESNLTLMSIKIRNIFSDWFFDRFSASLGLDKDLKGWLFIN